MEETNFIEAVAERDIDLLILEELHVTSAFRDWVIKLTYGDGYGPIQFDKACHSLSHPTLGESDLVLSFQSATGKKCVVLIEDKIDAQPQPEQGARYAARGEAGIEAGQWQSYKTCILAPQSYLSKVGDAETYDARISYEAVCAWIQHSGIDGERAAYKQRLLQEAIAQNRRGYRPKTDERITRFWRAYWTYANKEFPELDMKEPGNKPSKSTWIAFRPKELGKDRHILHKLEVGYVDLQINRASSSVDALKQSYSTILGQGMDVVPTGKSTSIRIEVEPIAAYADFDAQMDQVRAGLKAAHRLLYLSRVIR